MTEVGWYQNTTTPPDNWIKWDFGAGNDKDITALKLGVGATEYGSSIKDFKLQYSDDDSAWTDHIFGQVTAITASTVYDYEYTAPGSATVSASAPSPTVAIFCGASVSVSAPSPTTVAFCGGSAHGSAPSPTCAATGGGWLSGTAPSPTLLSLGHDSTGEWAANLTAPSPTLEITTGANSRLTAPSQTLAAAGTVTILATATLVAPKATLSASGTVSGMATADLSAPRPNLIGYGGAVCSVSVTGSPTLLATGTTGGIGGVQATCPLFELTASGTAQNYGSADLIAPSPKLGGQAQAWLIAPGATLTAIGTAVVTATYEAYAVNLKHTPRGNEQPVDEVTRYTNFPFTHVIRHQNSYYGVNSTGLYLLEGTTDDAAPISYAVKTGTTDFKQPEKKTVASAYLGGRVGPGTTLTLHVGEGAGTPYSYTTPRGQLAQNYRQAFGRGNKARYYALALSGSDVLELDNIELDVKTLTRRI